jgi:5-methylcytosine-specific restriction protein B
MENRFMQKTIYELREGSINLGKLRTLLDEDASEEAGLPHVLIIDEINRGSVSRIFGELITLVEKDKRRGMPEALQVCLPYSKAAFQVPDNVYLVGTMNTADRSLTGLDIALRRRFSFVEMAPDPGTLAGVEVEGLPLDDLLRILNDRITALLDREHRLGHAYFLPLRSDPTLERLSVIFQHQIMPLLQEYFFEDWERISWVLNDHRKEKDGYRFVLPAKRGNTALFGESVGAQVPTVRWILNPSAFHVIDSYFGILEQP